MQDFTALDGALLIDKPSGLEKAASAIQFYALQSNAGNTFDMSPCWPKLVC